MGTPLRLVAPTQTQTLQDPVLETYQREISYVFHALRWLGAVSHEVEDLAQEVFIALRRSWPHFDTSRPIRPYLFGVAFRVVSMQRRKRKREAQFGRLEVHDGNPDVVDLIQAKQARAMLLGALEKVPLRRRAVLVMHELDEIPMAQVASALGIPLFTAYSRLRKARVELEAALRRSARESGE
ncbi:MAG TPA: sigma-70 family RNA polymerase sigma factor [Polyangia bacterium]|nr:sigma-70 family RNA polymerase sigma factor [Polyangia bacterium]